MMKQKLFLVFSLILILLLISISCSLNTFYGVGEKVDTVKPKITVTSPSSGSYVTPNFKMQGTCSDNVKVTKVTIYLRDTKKSWEAKIDGKTWTYQFKTSDRIGLGDKNFEIFGYDAEKNKSTTQLYVVVDNSAPESINIISPQLMADVTDFDTLDPNSFDDLGYFINQTVSIKGEVLDDSPVKTLRLNLINQTTHAIDFTNSIVNGESLPANTAGNTKNFTFYVDSTALTDDTKYLIQIDAKDMAGNTITEDKGYLYVLQSSDYPTDNISTPVSGGVTFPESIAAGTCFDDDGIAYIYWYVGLVSEGDPDPDYTTWGTNTTPQFNSGVIDLSSENPLITSWNITTPDNVGAFKVFIYPVDENGLAVPGLADLNPVSFSQTVSDVPMLNIINPDPEILQSDDITVEVQASGSGKDITEIHYKIESALLTDPGFTTLSAPADFTANTTVTHSFTFDSNFYINDTNPNVHDIKISVYCTNSDAVNSQTMTTYLRGDNTSPTVSIDSPGALQMINGTQLIQGTVSDWSTVKSLYISFFENCNIAVYTSEALLDGDTAGSPTINKWYKISSPSTSWLYNFDTTIVTSGTINPYNFTVAAVDNLGNIAFSTQQYNLNQDLDRPTVNITQPAYSGSLIAPWNSVDDMEKFGQTFLLIGSANDDDGVSEVTLTLDLMNYFGGGHIVTSNVFTDQPVVGTSNWSYTIENLTITASDQYYRATPSVTDINGRTETGNSSYFRISNEIPVIEMIWPSTIDPDGDQREYVEEIPSYHSLINDSFGTVISNVKDDIYWDNDTANNHLYLSDNPKYFFGWDNLIADDDSDNDGVPDGVVYADFNENTLSIFNQENSDSDRSDYFRLMFKSLDPNVGGEIRKVELSFNGGSTWTTAFSWSGSALVSENTTLYDKVTDQQGDGYDWFYINVDTSVLGSSQIIKVKVTDNNLPTPYFSIASIQLTFDNTDPSGSFVAWGTNDPLDKTNISSSNPYLGGNADDNASGIRHVVLYLWDNQGTPESPDYGGTGSLTANVDSGIYSVSIPNLADIDTASDTDPDYWVEAIMYTPQNWRISDIYSSINPIDGLKLACIEVVDNAGNKDYTFQELQFSEYPPSLSNVNINWQSSHEGTIGNSGLTGETEGDRIWISGDLTLTGDAADDVFGDPDPGIDRIRIYIKNNDGSNLSPPIAWGTDSGEITGGTGVGSGSFSWTLSSQDTTTINSGTDGQYLMEIEVRDKVGVTTVVQQYIYIDNTAPTLAVSQPVEALAVTGDFKIYGTASDSGGYATNPINIDIQNNSSTSLYDWDVEPVSGDWEQWWDTTIADTTGFAKIVVTFTDQSLNKTIITRNISEDLSPPLFSSFTANGDSTPLDFATFTSLYSEFTGSQVYLVNNSTAVFTNDISDPDNGITSSNLYVSGIRQNNGTAVSGITDPPFDPAIDTDPTGGYHIGENGTYTYNGLPDGEYTYRAQLFQQFDSIEINKKKYFIVDTQKPHIWIQDMDDDDIVADRGHIDTQLDSDGTYATDHADDVSGVITIYVKVFDNYLLDGIQLRLSDYNFGAGLGNWYQILYRNPVNSYNWTTNSRNSLGDLDYFAVTILEESLQTDRDYVYFKLEFNTAYLTDVAGLDKNLEFRAYDMASNESYGTNDNDVSGEVASGSEPNPTAASPEVNYQKWAQEPLDIVPYITDISRSIVTERTKYGKFIVQQEETGLTLTGFNLAQTGTNWIRVFDDATVTTTYDQVIGSNVASDYTSIDLDFSTSVDPVTHSGWFRIMVNGVEAINNYNDNSKNTNKEDDGSGLASTYWNDDRYLQVWEVGDEFASSNDPQYPSMAKDPTNNDALIGAWSNYSDSDSYYATSVEYGTNNRTQIYSSYDPPEWIDIAVDNLGNRYTVRLENHIGGTGSTDWGELTLEQNNSGAVRIEELGNNANGTVDHSDGEDEMLFQFQNPRIALNGSNSYISYYDYFGKCLKYAVFNGATAVKITDGNHLAEETVVDGADDFATPNTTGNDVGLWSDIQFDSDDNRIVIVYYDTTNRKLRLARGMVEIPSGTGQWYQYDVTSNNSFIGYYVTMAMDSNMDLHIAAYKNSTGDLVYIKGTKTGVTYSFSSPVTIDSEGAVGAWCNITLLNDVPHISYMNSSMVSTFYGLKYAYYDTTLGDWEYGVVSAATVVNNNRTNIEVSSSANWGTTAIGYASSNFDLIYLKPEE
ncbi:MAG: Ig-like domain-containing protein [Spirochaetes bacterium]|nr:Ig-like domain-containing protein [Spirochaetota bacterium]